MIRLALIRHGHTAWNRAGRIQGRTDIPLDEEARCHLSQLRLPAAWAQSTLVASPLSRAVETATLIAERTPQTDPALIEMDWGDWEGQKGADLLEDHASGYAHIEAWGWDYRPPNGESPRDVWNRLQLWAAGLDEDTVAVCHIGIMRVLLARATGWNFQGPAPFRIKRDRLFVLELDGAQWCAQDTPVRLEARAP